MFANRTRSQQVKEVSMKKEFKYRRIVIVMLTALMVLSGCGESGTADRRGGTNVVENAIEQQMKAEDEKKEEEASSAEEYVPLREPTTEATTEVTTEEATYEALVIDDSTAEPATEEYLGEPDPNVDVDLTVMGKDMVYATVYQMMCYPEDFIGKKIKTKGTYTACWYEETQKWYTYCIIKDALACCQQGLEFTWEDGNHDMSEYPEEGTDIEIVGTFRVYKDFEDDVYQYCELENATMTVLNENSN